MKNIMIAAFVFIVCMAKIIPHAHADGDWFYSYYYRENGPLREFAMSRSFSTEMELMNIVITSTVGQLSRKCQAIVDGSIVEGDGGKHKKENQSSGDVMDTGLEIEVDEVVWGDTSLKGKSIPVRILQRVPPPEAGFQGWMFLTRKPLQPDLGILRGEMSVDDLDMEETPYWVLAGGKRGCISGSEDFMKELQSYVETSIGFYRDHTVEPIEMAKMLALMNDSRYTHLSKDAYIDFSAFLTSLTRSQQDDLMQREDFPPQIRERLNRIRERRKQDTTRTRSRAEFKSALEEVDFRDAMESGEPDRIKGALKVLGRFAPHEYNLYEDLWAPHLRPLLKHNELDVRVCVAGELAELKNPDPSVVNVLIEALRDSYWRNLVQGSLRRATGKDFPYDPTASEEKKEAQIEKWKRWWEDEGREKLKERHSEGEE